MRDERPRLRMDGDDHTRVMADWGRSGKRVMVSVMSPQGVIQAVLTVEQAAELGRFLSAGPDPL